MKIHSSTDKVSDSETGSYLRLIDSCTTQLKAQGHSRTCNESNEEEVEGLQVVVGNLIQRTSRAPD